MTFPLPMMADAGLEPPAGMLLWLDAADSSTITTSGSDVATWTSKGSGSFVFSPATSHGAPERISDGVQFAATSLTNPGAIEALACTDAGSNLIIGPVSRTIYAVIDTVSYFSSSGGCVLSTSNGSAGNTNYSTFMAKEVISANTEGPWYWERGGTTSGFWAHQAATVSDARHLLVGRIDGSSVRSAALDGAAFTVGGANAYSASGVNRCFIGIDRVAGVGVPANPLNAVVREILVYDSALTGTTEAEVRAYLNAKWSIY